MSLLFKFDIQGLCLFLAFVNFFVFFSCESYRTALEEQYFQRGQIAFEKKNYAASLEFFRKAQKVSVNNVARYRMAEIYLIQNKFEESRKLIKTLLLIDRKNILAHELNILWHIKKNEKKKAKQLYEELNSKNIRMGGRTYANVGVFYLNNGEYKTALRFFRKADEAGEKSVEMLIAYLATLRLYSHPVVFTSSQSTEEDNSKSSENTDEKKIQTNAAKQGDSSKAKSIFSGNKEEISVVDIREDIHVDIDKVISKLIELYNKNEISTHVLMQAAEDLMSDEFFVHAFTLYKAVTEKKKKTSDEKKDASDVSDVDTITRVKAYRELVNLIAKKQYSMTDEHAPLAVLTYVKEIFKLLFPRDENLIEEYRNSLFKLLEMEEVTDVLKTKLRELYDKYGLVVKSDEKIASEDKNKHNI